MLRGILSGNRPDITPAQIAGLVPVTADLLHAFGVYTMTEAQRTSLTRAVIVGGALIIGDAIVRVGRNVKDGAVEAAALQSEQVPPGAPTEPGGVVPVEAPLDPDEIEAELGDELDVDEDDLPSDEEEFGEQV